MKSVVTYRSWGDDNENIFRGVRFQTAGFKTKLEQVTSGPSSSAPMWLEEKSFARRRKYWARRKYLILRYLNLIKEEDMNAIKGMPPFEWAKYGVVYLEDSEGCAIIKGDPHRPSLFGFKFWTKRRTRLLARFEQMEKEKMQGIVSTQFGERGKGFVVDEWGYAGNELVKGESKRQQPGLRFSTRRRVRLIQLLLGEQVKMQDIIPYIQSNHEFGYDRKKTPNSLGDKKYFPPIKSYRGVRKSKLLIALTKDQNMLNAREFDKVEHDAGYNVKKAMRSATATKKVDRFYIKRYRGGRRVSILLNLLGEKAMISKAHTYRRGQKDYRNSKGVSVGNRKKRGNSAEFTKGRTQRKVRILASQERQSDQDYIQSLPSIYQELHHFVDKQHAAAPYLADIKTMANKINPVFTTGIVDVDCHPNNIAYAMMNENMLRRWGQAINTHQVTCRSLVANGQTTALQLRALFLERGFFCTAVSAVNWIFTHLADQQSIVMQMEHDDKNITLSILGDMTEVLVLETLFKETIGVSPCTALNYLSVRNGSVNSRVVNIPSSPESIPHQCFYPFLKVALQEVFDRFMNSRANTLFLLGPPGTGKTTFLSGFIRTPGVQAAIACTDALFETSDVVDHFMGSKYNALLMEDVSRSIVPRGDTGNEASLVATFLNASNGLANSYENKKYLFSTNLSSLDNVDSALLRDGRCFKAFQFDLLTMEQAVYVAEDRGVNIDHIHRLYSEGQNTFALSKVLNPPIELTKTPEPKRNGFGFIGASK